MKEVLEFLQKAGTFYVATVDGDQPRVRPFGAVCGFEGKLYLVTNNTKDVYRQMLANPKRHGGQQMDPSFRRGGAR